MLSDPGRTPNATLSLRGVSKSFAGVTAVSSVTIDVAAGEFMTFLGPSGSGKTTTLNMIAGFEQPSAGTILLNGQDISHVPPHRRGIGMVFQHYALFPHMTVSQNVAYPLRQRRVPRPERVARVAEALEMVRLSGFERRRPAQLSGGQQQRVALARALVFRPSVLLMDEPLGALDKRLREALQLEIKRVHQELGITFVYVTHDQSEALLLSDRIAVFRDGAIEQVGTAVELYERPRTRFVAEFIGDSNVLTGVVGRPGPVVDLDAGGQVRVADLRGAGAGQRATVVVRPERMQLSNADAVARPDCNVLTDCRVTGHRYLGNGRTVEVSTASGHRLLVQEAVDRLSGAGIGDPVQVWWRPGDCVVIAGPPQPNHTPPVSAGVDRDAPGVLVPESGR